MKFHTFELLTQNKVNGSDLEYREPSMYIYVYGGLDGMVV